MKRIILMIVAALTGLAVLAGCESERKISSGNLPDASQSFISMHFPGLTVAYAEKDKDDGTVSYSVHLSDGTEIDFNADGEWTSVECRFSPVPDSLIPEAVRTDLQTRIPGASVYKIEKEIGGYEISVTGNRELLYDYNGTFVREVTDR